MRNLTYREQSAIDWQERAKIASWAAQWCRIMGLGGPLVIEHYQDEAALYYAHARRELGMSHYNDLSYDLSALG